MQIPYEILNDPMQIRVAEGLFWQLETAPYGGNPTDIFLQVKDASGASVTSAVMPGAATVLGSLILLPMFKALSTGMYVLTIEFTNERFAPARPFMRIEASA